MKIIVEEAIRFCGADQDKKTVSVFLVEAVMVVRARESFFNQSDLLICPLKPKSV